MNSSILLSKNSRVELMRDSRLGVRLTSACSRRRKGRGAAEAPVVRCLNTSGGLDEQRGMYEQDN